MPIVRKGVLKQEVGVNCFHKIFANISVRLKIQLNQLID